MLEDTVILVAEDNEDHFELIRENLLLTYSDLDIIHFKNQQDILGFLFNTDAETHVEDRKRYILLLDISTSGLNGIETLKKIKQELRTKKIPVIILTDADDPETVEQCYDIGCSTYIVKPQEDQDFKETCQNVGQFLSVVKTASFQS